VELRLVHESHAIPGAQNRFLLNILAALAGTNMERRFGKPRLYGVRPCDGSPLPGTAYE
jgi:hypothetical protein